MRPKGERLVPPLVAALLAAGCGSGSPSAADTGSSRAKLIAYAGCMRAHGVAKFPDPDSKGNLLVGPASGIDPNAPRYVSAEHACAKLRPASSSAGMTPAQRAQALTALTHYAQCMRKHGIPMANPFSGPNGGVGYALPRDTDLTSPVYKQADRACRHFLPNG